MKPRIKELPESDFGYSLPLVLISSLILITGTALLANRAGTGRLSTSLQQQNLEAKEAAEIGMNTIINELNRERNRYLLVVSQKTTPEQKKPADPNQNLWLATGTTDTTTKVLRKNPCSDLDPDYSAIDPGNAASIPYGKWYINSNGVISKNPKNATRSFHLKAITRQNRYLNDGVTESLHPFIDRNDANIQFSGVGKVILQVEGTSIRNGAQISVVLEKEFELTPKCCGTSFGGEHGSVDYTTNTNGTSPCFNQDDSQLGIISGAAQNNSGFYQIVGSPSFKRINSSQQEVPINTIYCIGSSSKLEGCKLSAVPINSNLNVQQLASALPAVRTFPTTPDNPTPPTPGRIDASSSSTQFNSTNTTDFLHRFTANTRTTYVINAEYSTGTLPAFCRSSTSTIDCNLTNLNFNSNRNVIFRTGEKKLRFYFSQQGQSIGATGTPTVEHCITINYTNGTCTSTPSANKFSNLSFFGCPASTSCRSQSIQLAGGAQALKVFAHFPVGTTQLVGNTKFEGVIWTNLLQAAGNPTWIIPGSGVAKAFEDYGLLSNQSGTSSRSNIPFPFDFIARATNRFRWLH